MKRFFVLLCFFSIFTFQKNTAFAHKSDVVGTLGLVPGLGQIVNGDVLEGFGWAATSIGLILIPNGIAKEAGFGLWMYSMYDGYRDAGPPDKRYKDHNVFVNYLATFNPLNLIDPFSAPIVGFGVVTSGKAKRNPGVPNSMALRPIYYSFTGLGEEALFRGFLYPSISRGVGNRFWGATISSVIFAVAHGTGGAIELAPVTVLFRTVMGMIFCAQLEFNKYDLRKNIFTHAWYDVAVTRNGKISTPTFRINFGL